MQHIHFPPTPVFLERASLFSLLLFKRGFYFGALSSLPPLDDGEFTERRKIRHGVLYTV